MIINKPAFDANKLLPGTAIRISGKALVEKGSPSSGSIKESNMLIRVDAIVVNYTPFDIHAKGMVQGNFSTIQIPIDFLVEKQVTLTPLVPETEPVEKPHETWEGERV